MKRNNDDLPAESARELQEIIEHDKACALVEFDAATVANKVRRRITSDRSPRENSAGRRRRSGLRRDALVTAAMAALVIVVAAVVVRVVLVREPRTDPRMIARVLAGCEYFASAPLDPQPGSLAGRSIPTPERALEWSIQALLYRARRSSDGEAPAEGHLARTILAALAGAPPAAPAPWPRVDPDELERRIAFLAREGAFLRVFGNTR